MQIHKHREECAPSNQTIFEWTTIIFRLIIIFCPSRTWCLCNVWVAGFPYNLTLQTLQKNAEQQPCRIILTTDLYRISITHV